MEIITLIYLVLGFGGGYLAGKNSRGGEIKVPKEEMTTEEKRTLESLQKQLDELISYSGGRK